MFARKRKPRAGVIVSGAVNARHADRTIAVLAAIACLSFVLGLSDVELRSLPAAVPWPAPPVESSERDALLTLIVLDDAKPARAVPGARVRAFWEKAGRYYLTGSGDSDTDGRVVLKQVARGVIWVLVEAKGRARTSTQLVLGGEPRTLRIELPRAHVLRVSVRDETGNPIPRATVLVTAGDPLPYGALTAKDGSSHFSRLSAPPWTVKASAAGYESVTRSGVKSDETLTLRRLGSLAVRVQMPDGTPAPRAMVTIGGSALWPARRAQANGAGETLITGLLAGSYELKATHGQLVSESMFGLELGRGERESITLKLGQGRMVTALVTDGEGDSAGGVSDADVVLAEQGLSSFPLHGRTGRDGKVTLGPIAQGPAALAARAQDFVPRSAVTVPERLTGPVRLSLLRGATLKGEVADSAGHSVDGASIEVIGSDVYGLPVVETPELMNFGRSHFEWALPGPLALIPAGELGVMPGPVPPIPAVSVGSALLDPTTFAGYSAASVGRGSDAPEPWVTRLDGSFVARPVTPGRVRAVVRHPAYIEAISDAVTLTPGGEASIKVVLRAGGTLEGRIVDADHRAMSGARVDLVAIRGTLERMTITASDGSFAFAAVPSEVILSVARPDDPGAIAVREQVRVAEGEKKRIELVLPAPRSAVRISVRDERGRPVDSAQVSVLSLDPAAPLRRTLFTGPDGYVSIGDAKGLSLRVLVEAPGWARSEKSVGDSPESIEIVLRHGVLVEGKVTSVRGRRAVPGASVTAIGDAVRKATISDTEGGYRFRDIAPGALRLVVSHPDYALGELTVEVKPTGREDRALELPRIDLLEPGEVEGEVVDEQGRPVVAARVAVGVAPAYLPVGALPRGVAVTDTRGKFVLGGLHPGKSELAAYAADVGRGSLVVETQTGQRTRGVRIKLIRGAGEHEPAAAGSLAVTLGEQNLVSGRLVVIVHVADASEAERGGLVAGDALTHVDGTPVTSIAEARARLSGPVASDIVVAVRRGERALNLRIAREAVRR